MEYHDHDYVPVEERDQFKSAVVKANHYAYAVTEINRVGSNPNVATARRDLAALKALIDMMIAKLPPEKVDYETDNAVRP